MSVYIIAEAGVNHNGDIRLAKKLIEMAARCGADAVKFQTFKAEDCVNQEVDKVGYQKRNDTTKETQFEMLKRLELTQEDFKQLKAYATKCGIEFLSTPFSQEALYFLNQMGMHKIKLSSTELTNHPFLKEVAKCQKPIILSTGMSYLEEVKEAVDVIAEAGNNQVTVLHCTTNYPTPLEEVNIKAMQTIQETLGVEVGYSDHTEASLSAIAAVALGAKVIEKHITLDRKMEGPDHKASMEEEAFKLYVDAIRQTEKVRGSGIKVPTASEEEMRQVVRRSIVAKYDLKEGTRLTEEMLTYKRPGTGIAPKNLDKVLGKVLKVNLKRDECILETQLGE